MRAICSVVVPWGFSCFLKPEFAWEKKHERTIGVSLLRVLWSGNGSTFALQRPIENLISGITLYASEPVAAGNFYRFGGKIGTVEEIGLRATKVRTLDHTVISARMKNSLSCTWRISPSGKNSGTIRKSSCGMKRCPIRFGLFLLKVGSSFMRIPKSFPTLPGSVLWGLVPPFSTLRFLVMSTSRKTENTSKWLRILSPESRTWW